MYRDFSEKSKARLLELVTQVENEKWCNFTDWVGDRWYDFETWIGTLNIRNYLNNVNEYHKKVIDKNNTARSTIELIFGRVRAVDVQYCQSFKDIQNQLKLWKEYVKELSNTVSPGNGKFTTEYISSTMGKTLEQYVKEINSTKESEDGLYTELIGFDVTELFLNSRNKWMDAITIGWTGDWIKNLISLYGDLVAEALPLDSTNDDFKGYVNNLLDSLTGDNTNEIYVRKSIESLIQALLKQKHEMTDFYDKCTDALKPEQNELTTKIIKNFVKTGKLYTETELKELGNKSVSEIETEEILEWFRKQDNLVFLKNISDKINTTIGAFGDAVDTLELSAQIITKCFNDYMEDTKYLEAIKQALIDGGYDNKTVNHVVDSILWEYKNQYLSAAFDGIEKLAEIGVDKIVDKGIDAVLPLLNIAIGANNIITSVIGLDDTADGIANVYATQQYSYALAEKYEFYRQKINSGTYTEKDVEQCNLYLKLAKEAKLQEYKSVKQVLEKALNSAGASVFSNEEDKQYTRDMLVKIDAEIARLENM